MLRLAMILIANYDGALDDSRLAESLGQQAPAVWLADTTRSQRHLGFIAQDVVMAYNKGLRTN